MLWNGGGELFASFAISGTPGTVEVGTKFCACCTYAHYVAETSETVDPCVAQGAIGTLCRPPVTILLPILSRGRAPCVCVQRQTLIVRCSRTTGTNRFIKFMNDIGRNDVNDWFIDNGLDYQEIKSAVEDVQVTGLLEDAYALAHHHQPESTSTSWPFLHCPSSSPALALPPPR